MNGWHIMTELREKIEALGKQRGIAGQIDRVLLDTEVIFEDVETAKKSLEALKQGKALEDVIDPEEERGRDGANTGRKRSISVRRSFNFSRKSRDEKRLASVVDADENAKTNGNGGERPTEMGRQTVPAS